MKMRLDFALKTGKGCAYALSVKNTSFSPDFEVDEKIKFYT